MLTPLPPDAMPPTYDEEKYSGEYQKALDKELEKEPIIDEREVQSDIPPTSAPPYYNNDPTIPLASESVLLRGLQVPARCSYVSSGFKYPHILERAGVTKQQWSAFVGEVKQHGSMSGSQWLTTVGAGFGTFVIGELVIGFLGIIPAVIVGHKMRTRNEKQNFLTADRNGELAQCVSKWNENYFKARNLVIRVDVAGDVDGMDGMDVSTTKAFKRTFGKRCCGRESESHCGGSHRGYFQQFRDARARKKAGLRGRIVIIPLDHALSGSISPSEQEKAAARSMNALQGDGLGLQRVSRLKG